MILMIEIIMDVRCLRTLIRWMPFILCHQDINTCPQFVTRTHTRTHARARAHTYTNTHDKTLITMKAIPRKMTINDYNRFCWNILPNYDDYSIEEENNESE